MHLLAAIHILGLLLMVFSLSMLPPIFVALYYQDQMVEVFELAFLIIFICGLVLWISVHRVKIELNTRDGFIVVAIFWLGLSAIGAIPFLLGPYALSLTDAFFESISGLTTTGATVIIGLDHLPPSILYYRQQLQWLGGMGIIVLAIAVLPMLRIGGMQLYKAETPGPMKDSKLTPRIKETAKMLWFIYLSLTIFCALGYWWAGMSLFDAIGHAFSTIAIGGFSTHDASMGYFDNDAIYSIAIIFMFLSGINFALHFSALRRPQISLKRYWQDEEFRFYFWLTLLIASITVFSLHQHQVYQNPKESLIHGLFQAVSIGTTTGFTTAEWYHWPPFLTILLLFSSFIGGCAGSTGGGIKVIRFLLLIKQGLREIQRLIHPNAKFSILIGNQAVDRRIVEAVWGFFALYVASFTLMYLLLAATGIDLMTAFSAVAASMNNLGPGLGNVGAHYADLHTSAKWILCFAMLLGRLEIFTVLVLITPAFWRS